MPVLAVISPAAVMLGSMPVVPVVPVVPRVSVMPVVLGGLRHRTPGPSQPTQT